MNKHILFICMFLFGFFNQTIEAVQKNSQETYYSKNLTFSYNQDRLKSFEALPKPSEELTNQELTKLLEQVSYIIDESNLSDTDKTIFPAYLANAQKDFAYISHLLTGSFKGQFGPVTLWILQLFIPDATLSELQIQNFDPYSSAIAALVTEKAAQRLKEEKKQLHTYTIKKGKNLWHPTSPGYKGLMYGSAKTWLIDSSDIFVADLPPKEKIFWKEQCEEIKLAHKTIDGQKIEAVYYWAGLTSPKAGNWEMIADTYMKDQKIPLGKRLFARALFLSALADSNAVVFNSKYTYWVKRPSQMDPEIKPMIIVPNHPSYPSAHSTIGSTAQVVLTYLFPENKENWHNLTEEAGMSRIWGGIHYPADHKKGLELGRKVGMSALNKVTVQ